MKAALVLAAAVWLWVWGYFAHDATPVEIILSAAWPIVLPAGCAYHWWVWGTLWNIGTRRYVYTDRRWWQRGDREKRPPNWMESRG